MKYVRELEFEKKPDYKYLRGLFEDTSQKMGYDPNDVKFSWVELKENIIKEKLEKEEEERLKKNQKDQGQGK